MKALVRIGGWVGLMGCSHTRSYPSSPALELSSDEIPVSGDVKDVSGDVKDWSSIQSLFNLDSNKLHFAGFVFTPHPAPVRQMVAFLRDAFDRDPILAMNYYGHFMNRLQSSASRYFNTDYRNIGFTDSTTMGLSLLYSGLKIGSGQEVLFSEHDFYSTKESLNLRARRTGALVRPYQIYRDIKEVSQDEILENIRRNIRPQTRAIAVTWVHSDTGLKIPIKEIGELVAEVNKDRASEDDRLLLCVDGVHGLGIEDLTPNEMGCDFFVAGTHKALFGPRGTGIIWAKNSGWPHEHVEATIPSFFYQTYFGEAMTPGGLHSFEHRWALYEAFDLHLKIGKSRIANRIHQLNSQLKQGLKEMPHVRLITPMSEDLSAGLVCFEVEGMKSQEVVQSLAQKGIVSHASRHFHPAHARLSPGLLNSEEEVKRVLVAIADFR